MAQEKKDIDHLSYDRYVNSTSICNALALLAFQSNPAEYVQRLAILVRLKHCWTNGHNDVAIVCSVNHTTSKEDTEKDEYSFDWLEKSGAIQGGQSFSIETGMQLPQKKSLSSIIGSRKKGKKPLSSSSGQAVLRTPTSNNMSTVKSVSSKRVKDIGTRRSDTICKVCRRRLSTVTRLRTHLQRVHNVSPSLVTSSDDPMAVDGDDSSGFACTVCGRRFRLRWMLVTHAFIHTGERPYACRFPNCPKRFGQSSTRNYHERTHSDARPYVCSQCGLGFKLKNILRNHMTSMHGGNGDAGSSLGKYQCQECTRSFKLSGALRTHIRMKHRDDRPYLCTECPKRFKNLQQVKRHRIGVHSNERPVSCPVCERTFAQAGNMRTHMRTHTGERPYGCKVCGMTFSHSGTLRGHVAAQHKDWELKSLSQPENLDFPNSMQQEQKNQIE